MSFTDYLDDLQDSEPEGAPNSDLRTERVVLGSILLDPPLLATAQICLKGDDFSDYAHQVLFSTFCAMDADNEPLDVLTLGRRLLRFGNLAKVGGAGYIDRIVTEAVTTAHFEVQCQALAKMARVRKALEHGQRLVALGQRTAEPQELMEAAEAVLRAADDTMGAGPKRVSALLDETFERIEHAMESGGRIIGAQTGYVDFDRLTGGLRGGNVIVLGARPGMGKSAWALGAARSMARQGPVLYFSLEMPQAELMDRLLCAEASVDNKAYRDGMLSPQDLQRLTDVAAIIDKLPLYIDDTGDLTLSALRARVRRLQMQRRGPLTAIVIDYLQLMSGEGRSESREQEISDISRGMKNFAKQINVPILALLQLNREVAHRGKDARPKLSDFRGSGSLEQDADIAAFLYRPEMDEPNDLTKRGLAELIVEKNRHGPCGITIPLSYVGKYTRFHNLEEEPNSDR